MNIIKYKLLLWKAYVMTGYSLTQILKYIIMVFVGWEVTGGRDLSKIIGVAVIYAIFCYVLGWVWFKFELVNAEQEISNQFNPFVKQVRSKFVLPKNIKRIKS